MGGKEPPREKASGLEDWEHGFDLSGLQHPECPECALRFGTVAREQSWDHPSYARWHAGAVLAFSAMTAMAMSGTPSI